METANLKAKIIELAKRASHNRSQAIENNIGHLNSYYHGKLIAYEEILGYIEWGTTYLNREKLKKTLNIINSDEENNV